MTTTTSTPMPTLAQLLAATAWRELALPHDKATLRRLQRRIHPDLCRHPAAGEAFAHLQDLYDQGEFSLRVAQAERQGPGRLRWTLRPGFEDLALACDQACERLERARHPEFFTRRVVGAGGGRQRVIAYRRPPDDAVRLGARTRPATTAGRRPAPSPVTGADPKLGLVDASGPPSATAGFGATAPDEWWFLGDFGQLDDATAVWVAKRLAAAINQAALVGLAHSDINPWTVVVNPADHGLRLDGWWLGRLIGQPLTVRPSAPTPSRYLGGAPADDLLGVSQAAAMLAESGTTGELRRLFSDQALRPQPPTVFFQAVTDCSRRQFGADRWRPLARPATPPL
ncbi:MAG: hypothetical protein LBO20_01125 [Bifidobacteriaceae bacterium]|jgi:hypothetical protein|nr:hypothetical protein [Bifidobacteriaceae bacterium]